MSGNEFLDSNIFIYAYDIRNPRKQSIASDLIRSVAVSGRAAISYQVIQEFFNFALVKAASRMTGDDAQVYLTTAFRPMLTVPASATLVSDAIRIHQRFRLSWYDSLIVSAAQQAGCSILYTEDLQHGQQFGSVTIRNPFL